MITPKGETVELGKRGSFRDLIKELTDFSGYVEVSYKLGELSKAKVLLSRGKIVAAEIKRIISKEEISGNDALKELMELDNCVADIYALNEEGVAKAIEWNKSALVDALPEEEKAVEGGLSEDSIATPEDREAIMRKYGIRMPSEEEIDQLIISALEDTHPAVSVGDFESVQKALIDVANQHLGKLSRKVVEVIKSCSSMEELVDRFPEIQRAARSLVVFIPRKKIDQMLSEMEEIIGREI